MTAIIGYRKKGHCLLVADDCRRTHTLDSSNLPIDKKTIIKIHRLSSTLMVAQGGYSKTTDKAINLILANTDLCKSDRLDDLLEFLRPHIPDWSDDIRARWHKDLPSYLVFGLIGNNGYGRHVSFSLNRGKVLFDKQDMGVYFTGTDTDAVEAALNSGHESLSLPNEGKLSSSQFRQLSKSALQSLAVSHGDDIGSEGHFAVLKKSGTPKLKISRL